jgi:hypothetical protein
VNTNEKLYDQAIEAVQRLLNDRSVSQAETWRNLNALVDEIRMMQSGLDENDEGEE